MKQTAIKIIVGLLLIWVIYGFLGDKLKRFVMPEKAVVDSAQIEHNNQQNGQQSNVVNEQIKSTMRKIEYKLSADELAGCMVTDNGCSCYSKSGQPVKATKQQCLNYTKDSSGHSNKIAVKDK